jgi:hypothetical protein
MPAKLTINGTIQAKGAGCGGAVTNFAPVKLGSGTNPIEPATLRNFDGSSNTEYALMTCLICGRGAFAVKVFSAGPVLRAFYPPEVDELPLPEDVPDELIKEFREAELCASFGAWRAASAMLRSVLEKTLKVNGCSNGSLQQKNR